MSETTPTRSRFTSCLTRIERQKGHVVCTALDQRNVISAPQFGQLAVKWRVVSDGWRVHPQATWDSLPHTGDRGAARRLARRRDIHQAAPPRASRREDDSRRG